MKRMIVVALAAPCIFHPQNSAAQNPTASASIEGVVVAVGNAAPIAGATLELVPVLPAGPLQYGKWLPQPGPRYGATTSKDGAFTITNLPAGTYRLAATQALGFVKTEYGQRSAYGSGEVIVLADGQRLRAIQLAMTPAGAISGRVLDRDGEPLVRARVQALRTSYEEGRKVLKIVQSVQTDDLGEYRLFWLPPGPYYISVKAMDPLAVEAPLVVSPPGAGGDFQFVSSVVRRKRADGGKTVEESFVTVYYPGTTDARSSSPVDLRPGEHLGGINFSDLSGSVRSWSVRGRVLDAAGQPADGLIIMAPKEPAADFPGHSASTESDGAFELGGVAPGSYYLVVLGPGLAMQPIDVGDADLENVSVVAGVGLATLNGKVILQNADNTDNAKPPDLTQLRVVLERVPRLGILPPPPPAPPGVRPSGAVAASGEFSLPNILAGDYRVIVRGMTTDLYLKSARWGNSDVLSAPLHVENSAGGELQIVLSARPSTVRGRAIDEKRQPVAGATVVLVPGKRERRDLYRDAVADASGEFLLEGVADGDYRVFAWQDVPPTAWQNADFLQPFESRGKTLRIEEASRQDVEIVVIGDAR